MERHFYHTASILGQNANKAAAPVVRVLEDGPIPMGPYIYFDAKTHGVTTLLCRCMPSQVQRFVGTKYYDLAPVEELAGWRKWKQPGVSLTVEGRLQDALRWPWGAPPAYRRH